MTLEYATATNPTAITPEEYFNPDFDLQDRDIGRPIELTIRTQKFVPPVKVMGTTVLGYHGLVGGHLGV